MMKLNTLSPALLFCGLIIICFFDSGFCREDPVIRMKLGGVDNYKGSQNDPEIESLARFAVEEHNKKDNAFLEFRRLLRAKEQVVAGKVYYLTLEAMDAGKKKLFEAKVWVKPWMNFKQLQEFKHFSMISPFTTSELPEN